MGLDDGTRVGRYARAMADWSTAASLATALGTLVLALATFVAVRAANRAARVAETSMLIGIRPASPAWVVIVLLYTGFLGWGLCSWVARRRAAA